MTKVSALKNIDITKLSEPELDALMAQASEQKAHRAAQQAAEQDNRLKAVAATCDAFPISLGKALGHEISKADAAKHYALYLKGQLNKALGIMTVAVRGIKRASARTVNSSKAKRLSDETKAGIKGDMLLRAINLKLSQPNDTINVIAKRWDVSPQTVDKFRPSQDEITAAISKMIKPGAPVAPVVESAPAVVAAAVTA